MSKPVVTSATSEPIQAGRVARCSIGVRGLVPFRIDMITGNAVIGRPLNHNGDDWDIQRRLAPEDVWFLMTEAEVADLGVRV